MSCAVARSGVLFVCLLGLIACVERPDHRSDAATTQDVEPGVDTTPFMNVSWDKAKELLLTGDVVYLDQGHDGGLLFQTENGRRFKTQQPRGDMALELLERHGLYDANKVFYVTE